MKKINNTRLVYVFVIYILMIINIIRYKPSAFLYIPLFASVLVMLLQARVSRYAFLAGGINSVLYMISYIKMSLYAMAIYSISVSFPLQMITFFNWKHHTEKNETNLRKMSGRIRLIVFCGITLGFLLLYVFFLNSRCNFLDYCVSVFGIITSILCMLRFKEYAFVQIISNSISLGMFLVMTKNEPSRIIWVINSMNSLFSSFMALININKRKENLL